MPIPHFLFCTDLLERKDRWDAYKKNVNHLFSELRLSGPSPCQDFYARNEGFNFNDFLLVRVDAACAEHLRYKDAVETDGIDVFMLELNLGCEIRHRDSSSESLSRKGDILIMDFAQENRWLPSESYSILVLIMSRQRMMEIHPEPEILHGLVLDRDNPLTHLLGGHLTSLYSAAPMLDPPDGDLLVRPTLDILAAAIRSNGLDTEVNAHGNSLAFKAQVGMYVRKHLKAPNLSPDTIAEAMGVSRSHLYREFESDGGLARQILMQRLSCAYRELRSPLQRHFSVQEIAYKWGFSNYQTFSRAFKRAFDMTPSESRSVDSSLQFYQVPQIDSDLIDVTGPNWIRNLL